MTALRLLNTESQDKADYLHNQLITDINVPSTYWECAESYLKGVGIYDVFLIEEQDFRNYKIFLRETGNFTKKQVFERTGFLRNLKKTLIQGENDTLWAHVIDIQIYSRSRRHSQYSLEDPVQSATSYAAYLYDYESLFSNRNHNPLSKPNR